MGPSNLARRIRRAKTSERVVSPPEPFPELILAAETKESVPIIMEGHTRATAYVRVLPADAEVEALLGVSKSLSQWQGRAACRRPLKNRVTSTGEGTNSAAARRRRVDALASVRDDQRAPEGGDGVVLRCGRLHGAW